MMTNVEHLGNIWGTHPISVNRKGIYDLVGIKDLLESYLVTKREGTKSSL